MQEKHSQNEGYDSQEEPYPSGPLSFSLDPEQHENTKKSVTGNYTNYAEDEEDRLNYRMHLPLSSQPLVQFPCTCMILFLNLFEKTHVLLPQPLVLS